MDKRDVLNFLNTRNSSLEVQMGEGLPTKKHKMVCIRLERVNFPKRTKGLTSFSSVGPRLIWLVANGVFIQEAWDICDKCGDYHMSYKELIVCERCSPSDTHKSHVHWLLPLL